MQSLTITDAHVEFVKSEAGFLLREDVLCWARWYGIRGYSSGPVPHNDPNITGYLALERVMYFS